MSRSARCGINIHTLTTMMSVVTLGCVLLTSPPWAAASALLTLVAVILAFRRRRQEKEAWSVRERKLKESAGHADDIIGAIPSGLIGLDAKGIVRRWNEGATKILGVGRGGIVGLHVDAWPVQGQEQLSALLKDALAGRIIRRGSLEVTRSDGSRIPLGISTSHLGESDTTGAGVVAVFQDLSEVRQIRAKMKQQERLVAVGTLAASIAHEIRNPLASIAGSVELLVQELKLKGEMAELLDLILKESDRLNTLISNFLEYTREQRPKLARVLPTDLLRDVLRVVQLRSEATNALRLEIEADQAPASLVADPDLLKQIFLNLILNSCQAMEWQGEVRVRISGKTVGEQRWAHFRIMDTGPGIDEEHRVHLFDPFFTTKPKGTGLGLAIAHRFAEIHGGQLELVNEGGPGAEFLLRVPMRPLEGADEFESPDMAVEEIAVK